MAGPKQPFVIQEHHTCAGTHWDLMLQRGDVLWTWRLAERPEHILSEPIKAERIFDHALRFLSYEGPVQHDTGSVRIVERGDYTLENQTENQLELLVEGQALRGRYQLTRQLDPHWLLCFVPTV